MKPHGIERQTLAIAVIPILVLALLLEGYFTYTRFIDLDRALFERAKLIVRQLASSSEYPVFSGNQGLLQQQVDIAFSQQDVNSIIVLDADSKFIAGAGTRPKANEREQLEAQSAKARDLMAFQEDDNALWFYQPIVTTQINLDEFGMGGLEKPSNKALGSVIVEISKGRLNKAKVEMFAINLLLLLFVVMTTILIAMRVSRRITAPVLEMSNAIRRIGEGRLDTRIVSGNRVQELDALAAGINDMAQLLQQDRNTLQHRIDEATQELRSKKEEAERANYDKSRFLAAASHDLRQPMHALGLFVGELQSRLDTPEQRKIASKVEESAEAMSSLLDSLLDISKLDAGIVVPQMRTIDIAVMMRRLVQDYIPVAQRKHITLRAHCIEASAMSDPVLLERIVLNLLSNAIRYTPPNGIVLLACRRRGDNLRIEVRDSGIGIPAEEQQNVFREFVQLANSARDRSKGIGLGLAIVDRLAKLLEHPLALSSAPNRGSTFAITVPRVLNLAELLTEAEQAPAAMPKHNSLEHLQVAVVDDDTLVRTGTAGILKSWGCHVSVAENLRDFKEKFATTRFDLVICDYRMPDGDGLMLAAYIESHGDTSPDVILISGDTAPEILQEVKERGHHLLHKPVRPAKLRSLILFLLKNRNEFAD